MAVNTFNPSSIESTATLAPNPKRVQRLKEQGPSGPQNRPRDWGEDLFPALKNKGLLKRTSPETSVVGKANLDLFREDVVPQAAKSLRGAKDTVDQPGPSGRPALRRPQRLARHHLPHEKRPRCRQISAQRQFARRCPLSRELSALTQTDRPRNPMPRPIES